MYENKLNVYASLEYRYLCVYLCRLQGRVEGRIDLRGGPSHFSDAMCVTSGEERRANDEPRTLVTT